LLDLGGLEQVYSNHKRPPDKFPEESLSELLRTPLFHTWQTESWLTHCNDFMAYVGTWQPANFYESSPVGDGKALFLEMTEEDNHLWDESARENELHLQSWHATYYVFKCIHCAKLRGNWDCD
jgi:uncharacterized protein CbrC (UPF0167 family)